MKIPQSKHKNSMDPKRKTSPSVSIWYSFEAPRSGQKYVKENRKWEKERMSMPKKKQYRIRINLMTQQPFWSTTYVYVIALLSGESINSKISVNIFEHVTGNALTLRVTEESWMVIREIQLLKTWYFCTNFEQFLKAICAFINIFHLCRFGYR